MGINSNSSFSSSSLDLNLSPAFNQEDEVVPPKEYLESAEYMELQKKFSMKPNNDSENALAEELNRVSTENKRLTQMITVMCENYNSLRNQMMEYYANDKKRKSDQITGDLIAVDPTGSSSADDEAGKQPREEAIPTPKTSTVCIKTDPSDSSLVVRDGYQWRKYGQKVTRNNPSPRAYYKCSHAPGCPVKKKVQRSGEDQSMLVATYEGEHTHPMDALALLPSSSSGRGVSVGSGAKPGGSSGAMITMDLAKSKSSSSESSQLVGMRQTSPQLRNSLVEQMASSLTQDPNFTAAIAAAITGTVEEQKSRTEESSK